jgi:urease accessory protein
MTWLSPSYPVGAYTFSQGLETAVEAGIVTTASDAESWISDMLQHGNGQADLAFLACAWEAANDAKQLHTIVEHVLAFQATAELRREITAQGNAFLKASGANWICPEIELLQSVVLASCPYPVAVGVTAKGHGVDRHFAMVAFAQGYVSNLVSAAVRLIPLGQTDGQRIITNLMPLVLQTVDSVADTPLENVTTATIIADILSMQHESQYTRLFRS